MEKLIENLVNLAWVAGILEGEGSFGCATRKKDGYTCRVSVGMTDEDIIRQAQRLTGVGRVYGPYVVKESNVGKGPFKDRYQWITQGKAAADLMRGVYPFMGARRSQRISEILEGYEEYLQRKVNRNG